MWVPVPAFWPLLLRSLGLSDVTAIDIDYTAVRCARKNAEANLVADRITFSTDSLGKIAGVFDLVVANILPHILIDLRDALIDHTAAEGVRCPMRAF